MAGQATTRGGWGAEPAIDPEIGGESTTRAARRRESSIDHLIARLAARRHGIVTRRLLLAAGLSARQVDHRIALSRLHVLHRGVYAVGHLALTLRAHHLAAVLACGPGAVLSHESAAVEAEMLREATAGEIHVTLTRRCRRPGIRTHQAALTAGDIHLTDGIPMTSPARTLVDLAATASTPNLERALNEARVLRLLRPGELDVPAGARGARRLRALLDDTTTFTRSEAERRLVALVLKAQLPRPRTNTRVCGFEVDAHWPDHRLVVEVDGYATHAGKRAFERDRHRDAILQTAGHRVLRLTWRQLTTEPEATAARLAVLLHGGGASAT